MNPSTQTVPEYIVEELAEMSPMEKRLSYIVQTLLDLEVDLEVLSRERTKLDDTSARIQNSVRGLRLSLEEL